MVLWLVEPTTFVGQVKSISPSAEKSKTPVILVINKIDTVKKEDVPGVIETYRKLYDFDDIVPVSALVRRNPTRFIEQIFKYLPYGPKFYDEDTVTDQPMRQIVAELIREKALRCLNEEIPHGIAVSIDKMKERPNGKQRLCYGYRRHDYLRAGFPQGHHHRKAGRCLKRSAAQARYEIEDMLEMKVNLQLWVKVKKDWRDSDFLIKNFGYDKKDLQ